MIKIDTTNCYGNIENLSASRIYHIPTTLLLLPKCMLASQNILTTPLLLPYYSLTTPLSHPYLTLISPLAHAYYSVITLFCS